jgi:hypothetical protein
MKRLFGFGSATALMTVIAGVGAWTACVGDEPASPSSEQGALDQPCYANGTCLTGLTCEAGRCKPASAEGGAQTSSGGTSSGGTSSSSSGATCTATAAQDGPRCGGVDAGACPNGQACCAADAGGFACSTSCAADAGWQCEDGAKQCSDAQGHVCCITVAKQSGTDSCGAKAFTSATSRCVQTASDCAGSLKDYRVCNTADDCVGGSALKVCVVHDVETVSGSHFVLGTCESK